MTKNCTEERLAYIAEGLNPMLCIKSFQEDDFAKFIIAGVSKCPRHLRVGRVLQVRKGLGVENSDMVLIRDYRGKILVHENNQYQFVTDKDDVKFLESIFIEKEDKTKPLAAKNILDIEEGFLI